MYTWKHACAARGVGSRVEVKPETVTSARNSTVPWDIIVFVGVCVYL